jgi:hypothetical protein
MFQMLGRCGVFYITNIYDTFTASVSDGRRDNPTTFSPFDTQAKKAPLTLFNGVR